MCWLDNDTLVYVNNRVGEQIINNLIKGGFKVINDADGLIQWPDALIKCIKGEYNAFIFHSPKIRDMLIGVMISKLLGGYACDWLGNKIIWPDGGGVVPQAMFGFWPLSEKVLSYLKRNNENK